MELARSFTRNLAFILGSQVVTSVVSLLVLLMMPIYLGDTGRGRFAFAQSIAVVISSLTVLGTSSYITREVAAAPTRLRLMVWAALIARFPIWALSTSAAVGLLSLRQTPMQAILVVIAMSVGTLVWLTSDAFDAALRGLERMGRRSVAMVATNLAYAGFGVPLLILTRSPLLFSFAHLAGALASLAVNADYFRRAGLPFVRPALADYRLLILGAAPFMAMYAAQGTLSQLDTIMLGLLTNEATVGWFAAATTLAAGAIMFVPAAIFNVSLPLLTRIRADRLTAGAALRRLLEITLLIALPASTGLAVIAPRLFTFLHYPAVFSHSTPILVVQSVTYLLSALVTLLSTTIIAFGRERAWSVAVMVSVAIFLILNVVLIPLAQTLAGNGGLGAAAANALGESAVLVVAIALLPKHLVGWKRLLSFGLRVAVACAVMAVAVIASNRLPLPLSMAVGILVYAAASVLLRNVTDADRRLLVRLLRRAHAGEIVADLTMATTKDSAESGPAQDVLTKKGDEDHVRS